MVAVEARRDGPGGWGETTRAGKARQLGRGEKGREKRGGRGWRTREGEVRGPWWRGDRAEGGRRGVGQEEGGEGQ
jgi:hypothetical protein